jgi:hypothetical protein
MPLPTGQKVSIVVAVIAAIGLGAYLYLTRAEAAPPTEYCCPYCGACFPTYEALVAHIESEHPGERIPIPIEWD